MSLLNKLKEKRRERLTVKHPLYSEEDSFKVKYCSGIIMQSYVDENLCEKEEEFILDLLYSMGLSEESFGIIKEKVKNGDGHLIDSVINSLDTTDKKYSFIFDLLSISKADSDYKPVEREASEVFLDMLNIRSIERNFIYNFLEAADTNDNQKACREYEKLIELNSVAPNLNVLMYAMKEFNYIRVIKGYELKTGEILEIKTPCKIEGQIIVGSGAKLLFNDANVEIDGQIVVEKGQVSISNSNIKALEGCLKYFEDKKTLLYDVMMFRKTALINIINVGKVEIKNSVIDGNNLLGIIKQQMGSLDISETLIKNTTNVSAIEIIGNDCNIYKSSFENCIATGPSVCGGAINADTKNFNLEECTFENCGSNNHGGAIFLKELKEFYNSVYLNNCIFNNCHTQYKGAAIYLENGNRTILNKTKCQYTNCHPSNSIIY